MKNGNQSLTAHMIDTASTVRMCICYIRTPGDATHTYYFILFTQRFLTENTFMVIILNN